MGVGWESKQVKVELKTEIKIHRQHKSELQEIIPTSSEATVWVD